jgi:hypothetical protein
VTWLSIETITHPNQHKFKLGSSGKMVIIEKASYKYAIYDSSGEDAL